MLSALDFAEKSNDLISIGCAYRGLGEILKSSDKAEDAAVYLKSYHRFPESRRYLRCRRSKRTHVKITSYFSKICMFHLTLCYGSLVPCSSNGSLSSLPAMFRWVFPHCCIASMIGDRVLPKSVRLYSVFGGKDDTRPVSGSFYVTTSFSPLPRNTPSPASQPHLIIRILRSGLGLP